LTRLDPENTPLDPGEQRDAEHGRAIVMAASREVSAPLALRERIENERQRAAAARRPRRRWAILASLAAVAAVAAAVVVIAGGGAAGAPSVVAAASLAGRGPALGAPAPDPSNPAVLAESVDGVQFPQWRRSFKWRTVGRRYDTLDGRKATTVFYENPDGARAAYTILTGGNLKHPAGARSHVRFGTHLYSFYAGGRQIVTWTRRGHTCVMSAPAGVPEDKLYSLAAWKGDKGHVDF
jgi:hypothetical protein